MVVKDFDQRGLYSSEQLSKTQSLFFQPHNVHIATEDIGQGVLYGSNLHSYDLSPVSSSNGFVNWARNTFRELFSPLTFLFDGIRYTILVVLVLIFCVMVKNLKNLLLRSLTNG